MPCTKAPVLGSKPHFYGVDEEVFKHIDGLTPNEEDHDIFIHFETVSTENRGVFTQVKLRNV
jgi:hypothetical protein